MKVTTQVNYADVDGDYGTLEGVEVTCDRCGYSTESAGTSDASLRRCAVMLHEECPKHENNFYVVEGSNYD